MRLFVSFVALVTVACVRAPEQGGPPPIQQTSTQTSTQRSEATGTIVEVPADAGETPVIREEAPVTVTEPRVLEPVQKQREITIDDVAAGNPVIVSGRARTFENNVIIRVRDARGQLVTETFTTSSGEMGRHNPYRGSVWLTRDPGREIVVEALEYSANDGSERSLIARRVAFDHETIPVQLAWPSNPKDCTKTKAFTRRLPKSVSMARLLVETLIAGPTADESGGGARGPFPQGSQVRSVNLRDGVLTVDFNERLQNVGGSCAAQSIRVAVTDTLQRLPSVQRVRITAGGDERLALQP